MVREKQTGDVYALKSVRKEQARKRVIGAEDERDILANASGQWTPRLQYAFQVCVKITYIKIFYLISVVKTRYSGKI